MELLDEKFTKSIIEKQFVDMLEDPEIQVVSFDIFNTLVFRTCASPDAVFLQTGNHPDALSVFDTPDAFAMYRKCAARKALAHTENSEDVTLADIYRHLPLDESEQKTLQNVELQWESRMIVPNPQTDRWIKLAHDSGKQVILTSDMYLSSKQIEHVALSKLTHAHLVHTAFVSSEVGLKKTSGNLFSHLLSKLAILPRQLLHVGDHLLGDVQVPGAMGVHILPYTIDNAIIRSFVHEKDYLQHSLLQGEHVRQIAALCTPFEQEQEKQFFTIGCTILGPALFEFSHWLIEKAAQFQLNGLAFLLREGELFRHCVKLLNPSINTCIIHASRKSTALAATDPDDISEVANFNLFHELQIADLYDMLHLPIAHPDIERYKHSQCKDAELVKVDDRSLRDIFSADILSREAELAAECDTQREYLTKYLRTVLVPGKYGLVDFGAGGTVISRFMNVLPEDLSPHVGLLFYQDSQAYRKRCGEHIVSFLPPTPRGRRAATEIYRSCDIFEVLLNGTAASTTSYSNNGPVTISPPNDSPEHRQNITAVQTGIDLFFQLASHCNLQKRTWSAETIALIISRLISYPTLLEATHLGNLKFDHGRGSNSVRFVIDDTQIRRATEQGVDNLYQNYMKNTQYERYGFPWIPGVVTRISPEYLEMFFSSHENPNDEAIRHLVAKARMADCPVVIFGAGEFFKQLVPALLECQIKIEAVVDSRAETEPFEVLGYTVTSLRNAFTNRSDVTFLIASAAFTGTIRDKIRNAASDAGISVRIISCN